MLLAASWSTVICRATSVPKYYWLRIGCEAVSYIPMHRLAPIFQAPRRPICHNYKVLPLLSSQPTVLLYLDVPHQTSLIFRLFRTVTPKASSLSAQRVAMPLVTLESATMDSSLVAVFGPEMSVEPTKSCCCWPLNHAHLRLFSYLSTEHGLQPACVQTDLQSWPPCRKDLRRSFRIRSHTKKSRNTGRLDGKTAP